MRVSLFGVASRRGTGSSTVMGIGIVMIGLFVSTLAIDMGTYFAVQAQLQTAIDSATLAGARQLPEGEWEAEEAALEMAQENYVAGQILEADQLSYVAEQNSFEVRGQMTFTPTVARVLYGGCLETNKEKPGCNFTVHARAKAVPAARDTILVIDTSSSMNSLGGNRPFRDVKDAANAFVNRLLENDIESVDRIAVAQFDTKGKLNIKLTSQQDSSDFQAVKNAITDLKMYSGGGWNTNFEAGLKVAVDEMESRGRKNANKTIIFLTDGYPNLPENSTKINTCVNHYNQGVSLQRLWQFSAANTRFQQAKTCAENYTNNFISRTEGQVVRAKQNDITIHTIQISEEYSASLQVLRTLLQDPDWDSELITTISDETEGEHYAAAVYDRDGIMEIYNTVASKIKVKLAG